MKPRQMTKLEKQTFESKEFLIILTFPMWTAKYNFDKAFLKRNNKLPISICYSKNVTSTSLYHMFFDPRLYERLEWRRKMLDFALEVECMKSDMYYLVLELKKRRRKEIADKKEKAKS